MSLGGRELPLPAAKRDEILRRAELARRELRNLEGDSLSAQGKQRLGWVLHDLDVIVASALHDIVADIDEPALHLRRQRDPYAR
jgi:hypothetical protein